MTTVVSFRSGGQDWAVPIERVQRVLGARGLLPLPDPRPGVAGLLHFLLPEGKLNPERAEIAAGQCRLRRYFCHAAHCRHVAQQHDVGNGGQQELRQDPIVPEQAPRRPQ